jgi:hypothetical protein
VEALSSDISSIRSAINGVSLRTQAQRSSRCVGVEERLRRQSRMSAVLMGMTGCLVILSLHRFVPLANRRQPCIVA